jgi:hypothetical protein
MHGEAGRIKEELGSGGVAWGPIPRCNHWPQVIGFDWPIELVSVIETDPSALAFPLSGKGTCSENMLPLPWPVALLYH